MFQATRPHGARLDIIRIPYISTVSSHAPARGATGVVRPRAGVPECFKPRARTGRDIDDSHLFCNAGGFKPRARTGRDEQLHLFVFWQLGFKPRARTGRDNICSERPSGQICFKPRARTGRDKNGRYVLGITNTFQATRPHGARRTLKAVHSHIDCVSSHAPARGATRTDRPSLVCLAVSSHAPARGATVGRGNQSDQYVVSSHAPARGAT